jgi:hypothetical protein
MAFLTSTADNPVEFKVPVKFEMLQKHMRIDLKILDVMLELCLSSSCHRYVCMPVQITVEF